MQDVPPIKLCGFVEGPPKIHNSPSPTGAGNETKRRDMFCMILATRRVGRRRSSRRCQTDWAFGPSVSAC